MNDSAAANPLLVLSDLPDFASFTPAHVTPAIDELLAHATEALAAVTARPEPPTWENLVEPLDSATEHLSRAWGLVGHLSSVDDSKALREAYNANLPKVTQFWTALGQNRDHYARYRALGESELFGELSASRRRVVENALRDFRLGGADLQSPARERFAEIQDRQASLSQRFSENVLDATNAHAECVTDESRLAGLPDDALEAAAAEAERAGTSGHRFTLQFPSYFPVMQYAQNRELRESMYRAYATRASDQAVSPADANERTRLDNAPVIEEIMSLRGEEAKLLGYDDFASVSLVAKMAESPEQVENFLLDLAARARPFAERDLNELRAFAADELGLPELAAWDMAFASERLRQARYAFSDQEVKQYFQLPRVLDGLFGLVQRLFDVRILPDSAPVWHDSVSFFRIERDGALLGQFYVDLFARPSKRPGAWMDGARSRGRCDGRQQSPIAYLVCNFQPPVGKRPALLTHDDVTTLFHEFGHGLHHLLTRVDELGVSGISGVEWDAVELPSQFMENFCWEWEIVSSMSAHVSTGASLPRELFDRMLAARNFQAGMQTLRQIEFSLFDMRLHRHTFEHCDAATVQALLDKVRADVAVVIPPRFNRFQNSFSHIFSGGYSAGYYSYKWAEVLSADAYAAFEEAAGTERADDEILATGRRFLDEILAVGGSRPAIDSFRAFRGRDPEIDALLRHNGMTEEV
ncbi:MAG: M3 family metallopeptidase [Burkholderiaceae bacterium]